jgi:hypothetical protein
MPGLLKTKQQLKLFAKWNKKLEKYDDCNAEVYDWADNYENPDPELKSWHSFKFRGISPEEFQQRTLYYENARALLETGTFKNKLQKKIWEYYSEGLALREIEKKIKLRYSKDTINKIIKEIIKCQMPK